MSETFFFKEGETKKSISISIITDYNWGKGAYFRVQISRSPQDTLSHVDSKFHTAKVMVSDERRVSDFAWVDDVTPATSTDTCAILYLQRLANISTPTTVSLKSCNGSGIEGMHYVAYHETVTFEVGETSKQVKVELINWVLADGGDSVNFFVGVCDGAELTQKACVEIQHKSLADSDKKKVSIEDLENLEDEQVTWAGQFKNALSVNGGGGDDAASVMDCLMHYIAVAWKLTAAFIPPSEMGGN